MPTEIYFYISKVGLSIVIYLDIFENIPRNVKLFITSMQSAKIDNLSSPNLFWIGYMIYVGMTCIYHQEVVWYNIPYLVNKVIYHPIRYPI